MKLPLAIGVAAAATLAAAYAQPMIAHTLIEHGGPAPHEDIDADEDGWIARAEASAAFERIFARLDDDGDGLLGASDRQRRIEMHGPGHGPGRHGRHGMDGDCTRTVEPANAAPGEEQRITVVCEREEDADGEAASGERHVERRVMIHGGPGGPGPHAGGPPPMFMMLIANSEEADANGDGSLSLEEFRAQHLRFFDASDANGDGRVRFEPPPTPPEPPAPPAPPQPPAPPR